METSEQTPERLRARDVIRALVEMNQDLDFAEQRIQWAVKGLRELAADTTMHPSRMRAEVKRVADELESPPVVAFGDHNGLPWDVAIG